MSLNMYRHLKTGAAAIAETIAPTGPYFLEYLKLHLSGAGGAGNLTITVDADAGAAYDLNVLTADMTLLTDLIWIPDRPIYFTAKDELDIAWANGAGRTYGLEVGYSPA